MFNGYVSFLHELNLMHVVEKHGLYIKYIVECIVYMHRGEIWIMCVLDFLLILIIEF